MVRRAALPLEARAGGEAVLSGEAASRRLAVILAADVAGYSRLLEADEEGTRFNNCVEGSVDHIRCPLARARGAGADDGAGGAARARGWCATAPRFNNCVEAPRSPSLSPTRAREALMMAGAGGAMRATGWRATAIRFQQLR